jgi:hypothetical protein
VFSAVGDGERSWLANGNDFEILNENAMIHSLPFAMFDSFNLRPLFPEIWTSQWPPVFHRRCLSSWRIVPSRMARNIRLFMIAGLFCKRWRRVLLIS